MSSVPLECREFAAEVESLEAAEAAAKDAIAGLAGADAWVAPARLATLRRELDAARSALNSCVASHSGSFQMRFVVVAAGPPPFPTGREAQLYEPGQFNPTARSVLSGETFSFGGPLPPRFGIIVVSQGLPDDFAVDFRTGLLEASSLLATSPIRAEIVVGPEVRFHSVDVARWASAIPLPIKADLTSSAAGVSARVTVLSVSATLGDGKVTVHAGGQIDWTFGVGLPGQTTPFTATLLLGVQLPPTPMDVEPCYVRLLGDPDVEISGLAGALATQVLPIVRDLLEGMLTKQVQQILVRELRVIVAGAFALTELPPGVTVSVRRIRMEGDAASFQPVIGAMGTTLSTFHPPAVL
jgi:hypothetical protein